MIVTKTGFDMDPFVVVSLGRKTYRTRCIRHNLNPVYEEKMVFQIMKHEQNYSLSFSVVDRDKLSGNDFVGTVNLPLDKLISVAPEADAETGLYSLPEPPDTSMTMPTPKSSRFKLPMSRSSSATSLKNLSKPGMISKKSSQNSLNSNAILNGASGTPIDPNRLTPSTSNPAHEAIEEHHNHAEDVLLKSFDLPIILKNKDRWEAKHNPQLYIRAKYLPYPALRQQFWRAMLKQYDSDENSRVSKVELTTMLDTLGSTLRESTIDGFFERFGDENDSQDPLLTYDQTVMALEEQLNKPPRKKTLGDSIRGHMDHAHFTTQSNGDDKGTKDGEIPAMEGMSDKPLNKDGNRAAVPAISQDYLGSTGEDGELLEENDLVDERGEEHVVEIRECPMCHQPRLNKKSDADIITHIATCASSDWRQVNNLVMAGFVTSSQAQRKWYSKVITKISYGGYKLGANSANILVQDRISGQINEERMSVYVRIGIRLLYKGLKSRDMEKKRSKFVDLKLYSETDYGQFGKC